MKERPILMSAPMIRAILFGTKTQTRRIVKPVGNDDAFVLLDHEKGSGRIAATMEKARSRQMAMKLRTLAPMGRSGDRLIVRETWRYADWTDEGEPWIEYASDNARKFVEFEDIPEEWGERLLNIWTELSKDENYNIDNRAADRCWRPSIHMPRWASRITLEIVGVRVERLQDISEEDAAAEGVYREPEDEIPFNGPWYINAGDSQGYATAKSCYEALWDSINSEGSWEKNPWVWVIEFRRIM